MRLPIPKSPNHKTILETVKASMGFLPNSLLYMTLKPELLYTFSALANVTLGQGKKTGFVKKLKILFLQIYYLLKAQRKAPLITDELKYLIAYVSSSSAGCTYCRKHSEHSLKSQSIDVTKFNDVWKFENSSLFNNAEKVALKIARDGSLTPNAVTDDDFKRLRNHFSDEAIIEILSVIALFGFLNRWNDTLKTELESLVK